MNPEEMALAVQKELEAFKNSLGTFVSPADMQKAFTDFKADTEKQYGEQKAAFDTLQKAMEAQGAVLKAIQMEGKENKSESLREQLIAKKDEFKSLAEGGENKIVIATTRKAVVSANATSDTDSQRIPGVGQINRGIPFMRDLFNVVNLSTNSHGAISWWEQLAVTNNATNVAETRTAGTSSNLTWVEKTLSSRRIFDWTKIGMDMLKDVDFVLGEVQRLVTRNMTLKENDQLINGVGTGNEIAGILTYATAFDPTGIQIEKANLADMLGAIKTQIATGTYGAAMPNAWIANNVEIDNRLRFVKDADGAYIFPQLALGGSLPIQGMQMVEQPLASADTLLVGDFTLGTVYVWDNLVIEIAQIEDDKKTGLTTIMAYMRENLLVRDVDKKAFIKVAALDTDMGLINKQA